MLEKQPLKWGFRWTEEKASQIRGYGEVYKSQSMKIGITVYRLQDHGFLYSLALNRVEHGATVFWPMFFQKTPSSIKPSISIIDKEL